MGVAIALPDVGFGAPETTATLSVDHLARLALTLDLPPLEVGQPLPLLWHWCCFTPTAATGDLGPDGHPRTSAALAERPRRMWGAGRVRVVEPLVVGDEATRRTTLNGAREVAGRSGGLLIVSLGHIYLQHGRERLREEQTIVYRAPGPPIPLPTGEAPPGDTGGWRRDVDADPRLLFRYSATTFNTHRIHYDIDYARDVEGYPALVVQGPLTAQLLAAGAAADAGRPLRSFGFRATNPLFAGARFTLAGRLDGTDGTARAIRHDGAVAVEADYTVDP